METLNVGLVWFSLQVLLNVVPSASGAKIQLYGDTDYTGLLLEIYPTNACYNVPSNKKANVYSVITDTCFIVYLGLDCKSNWSRKYMSAYPNEFISCHSGWHITSLHICNDLEGGLQLNMDITTHLENSWTATTANHLEHYYDICSCLNVPKYVQNMTKWSINNYANGLFAYFEPDCNKRRLDALYIEAGHSPNSRDMHKHTKRYRGTTMTIQSFGPASNTTYFLHSCYSYQNDKIMKLELFETSNNFSPIHFPNETALHLTFGPSNDLIHFFASIDYEGFRYESSSTSKCNKFPKPVQKYWTDGLGSMQTRVCVILFLTDDCTGRSVKVNAPGNNNLTNVWESTVTGEHTLSLLYTQYPDWKWEAKSYHVCNEEEGGSILNVDIVSDDPNVTEVGGPVTLERYANLCSCRNVPGYIKQLDRWFINNHGNSVMAYFSPNCSTSTYSPLWIPAGQNSYSIGLGLFKIPAERTNSIIHKIRSIGPDPNSDYFKDHCNRNCTTLSSIGNEDNTKIDAKSVCDFETKTEGSQIALLILERMQTLIAEFQHLSNKVDAMGRMHRESELNLENTKHDFNDKLEKQRDEIQELTEQINLHIHE